MKEKLLKLQALQNVCVEKALNPKAIECTYLQDTQNQSQYTLGAYRQILVDSTHMLCKRYDNCKTDDPQVSAKINLELNFWLLAQHYPLVWRETLKYLACDLLHTDVENCAGIFLLDAIIHEGIYGQWPLVTQYCGDEVFLVELESSSAKWLEEMQFKNAKARDIFIYLNIDMDKW